MTKKTPHFAADIAATDLSNLDVRLLKRTLRSKWTLVVPSTDPIKRVVADANKQRANVVVTLDDSGEPTGVILPALLSGSDAAENAGRDVDQNVLASFRQSRPMLFWCDKHKHYTTRLPCPV